MRHIAKRGRSVVLRVDGNYSWQETESCLDGRDDACGVVRDKPEAADIRLHHIAVSADCGTMHEDKDRVGFTIRIDIRAWRGR